jgi:hypothetical protein
MYVRNELARFASDPSGPQDLTGNVCAKFFQLVRTQTPIVGTTARSEPFALKDVYHGDQAEPRLTKLRRATEQKVEAVM